MTDALKVGYVKECNSIDELMESILDEKLPDEEKDVSETKFKDVEEAEKSPFEYVRNAITDKNLKFTENELKEIVTLSLQRKNGTMLYNIDENNKHPEMFTELVGKEREIIEEQPALKLEVGKKYDLSYYDDELNPRLLLHIDDDNNYLFLGKDKNCFWLCASIIDDFLKNEAIKEHREPFKNTIEAYVIYDPISQPTRDALDVKTGLYTNNHIYMNIKEAKEAMYNSYTHYKKFRFTAEEIPDN